MERARLDKRVVDRHVLRRGQLNAALAQNLRAGFHVYGGAFASRFDLGKRAGLDSPADFGFTVLASGSDGCGLGCLDRLASVDDDLVVFAVGRENHVAIVALGLDIGINRDGTLAGCIDLRLQLDRSIFCRLKTGDGDLVASAVIGRTNAKFG